MRRHAVNITPRLLIFAILTLVVLAPVIHSSLFAAATGSGTNQWVNFYSTDSLYYGNPLPVGAVVSAMDPAGVQCGAATVANAGQFGLMPCYGDDSTTIEDEGAEPGDRISFKINDTPATAIPLRLNNTPVPPSTDITWNQHGDLWEVRLVAADTPNTGLTIRNTARTDPLCVNWFQHYDMTLTNGNDTLTLTGATITDVLPLKTYLLPALTTPGYSYDPVTRAVVWTFGMLGPGEQRSVHLEVGTNSTLAEGETVQNEALGDSNETAVVTARATNVMTRQSPPCNPSPTATATPTPTASPTPSATPTPTASPTPSMTATPTLTATASSTPTLIPESRHRLYLPVLRNTGHQ